jgi:hypothetical protein
MTQAKLALACIEAKRFMAAADKVLKVEGEANWNIYPSKESGALRRASMDLTRALAELRRSQ